MQYSYKKEISGGMEKINILVSKILKDIRPIIKDEHAFFDSRLVLNELLINCHKHGNKNDDDKKILLEFNIDDDIVNIKVKDEGSGIKSKNEYRVKDYLPNGRGLILVEALADNVEYEKNVIKCSISIS